MYITLCGQPVYPSSSQPADTASNHNMQSHLPNIKQPRSMVPNMCKFTSCYHRFWGMFNFRGMG